MKVTVELTDEQADRIGRCRPGCESESMLRDAIVAARPKPLKVGSKVRFHSGDEAVVVAMGVHRHGEHWFVCDEPDGPVFTTAPSHWSMADGSPIVWPE